MYYLQSRYYDPIVGRFINTDNLDLLPDIKSPMDFNLYTYCANDPINITDASGFASIKSILSKIENFLNNVINNFKNYLLYNLFSYDSATHIFSVSATVMSALIDAAIAIFIRSLIYRGLKTTMRALLQIPAVRRSFIGEVFDLFLTKTAGKIALWVLAQIGFIMAGKPGALGTITSAVFQGFLENILEAKTYILGNAVSFILAFSSVGGIISLLFDVMDGTDRKPDGWVSIKVH